jgi:hypothetical protein
MYSITLSTVARDRHKKNNTSVNIPLIFFKQSSNFLKARNTFIKVCINIKEYKYLVLRLNDDNDKYLEYFNTSDLTVRTRTNVLNEYGKLSYEKHSLEELVGIKNG